MLFLCSACAAQPIADPPEQVVTAFAQLVQFALDVRLMPSELEGLGRAVAEEWRAFPADRADLRALPAVRRQVADTPVADREGLRAALRERLGELVRGDPSRPLNAWLAAIIGADAGDRDVPSRKLAALAEAAVSLHAAAWGHRAVKLGADSAAAALDSLRASLEGASAEAIALAQRGDEVLSFVASAFGVEGGSGDQANLLRVSLSLHPPLQAPVPAAVAGTHPPTAIAEPASRITAASGLALRIPRDWTASKADSAGLVLMRGPKGVATADTLSNGMRVYLGQAPKAIRTAARPLRAFALEAVGADDRASVSESCYGDVLVVSVRPRAGSPWLTVYAARLVGSRMLAMRGEWPLDTYDADACVALFRAVWASCEVQDAPAARIEPAAAADAAARLMSEAAGELLSALPPPTSDSWLVLAVPQPAE